MFSIYTNEQILFIRAVALSLQSRVCSSRLCEAKQTSTFTNQLQKSNWLRGMSKGGYQLKQ